MGLEPRVYPKGTKFDGLKFNWIGSLAKLSGRRTTVTIASKKVKRKALKAGMNRSITDVGNMGRARKVAC